MGVESREKSVKKDQRRSRGRMSGRCRRLTRSRSVEQGHSDDKNWLCTYNNFDANPSDYYDDNDSDVSYQTSKSPNHEKQISTELELVTERFSKLLLGEDMSGGKKGVSSALALSNAITNLSASIFGELWRLEPLATDRKKRWRKEIGWFLSVVDHIVEFVPSYQSTSDGSLIEVMVTKPRSDIQMNIPALKKLEAMLFECLDKFVNNEFWYEQREQDTGYNNDKSGVLEQVNKDKWWLPVPKVPEEGLSVETRKKLQNQRDSVSQILKAAMAINSQVLSEMEIPDVYWESHPKKGRAVLGESLYKHLTSENFCPEVLLCSLDLSSDHSILDTKNKIEAALSLWKKRIQQTKDSGKRSSMSTWGSFGVDDSKEVYVERAETILILLKLKFPGLPQSTLEINKIHYNRDVGQSVLESYSRVLESLAYNILSRIKDVIKTDDAAKKRFTTCSTVTLYRDSPEMASSESIRLADTENFLASFAESPLRHCIYPSPSHDSQKSPEIQNERAIRNNNNTCSSFSTSSSSERSPNSIGRMISTGTSTPCTSSPSPGPGPSPSPWQRPSTSVKRLSEFIGCNVKEVSTDDYPIPRGAKEETMPYYSNKHGKAYYYWSFMENLDRLGSVPSPPSRD